jgi:hypothetical protein
MLNTRFRGRMEPLAPANRPSLTERPMLSGPDPA